MKADVEDPNGAGSDLPINQESVVSTNSALRLLLGLLALWTLLSGLALVIFQDASEATIGGGLSGGEGTAAQRLLGVHMLVLAPLYALLAWEPRRFRLLLWVPYAALGGTLLVTLFDILTGDRDIQDGLLPFVVNLIFFSLLVYVWRASRPMDGREVPSVPQDASGQEPTAATAELPNQDHKPSEAQGPETPEAPTVAGSEQRPSP